MTRTITGSSAMSIDELPNSGTASRGSCAPAWTSPHSARRSCNCRPTTYTTESDDEADTGQQELCVALAGTGAVVIGDERLPLDPKRLVRVDAGTGRVLTSGPDGLRVLCIGAIPGRPYEPPAWTTGAADGD